MQCEIVCSWSFTVYYDHLGADSSAVGELKINEGKEICGGDSDHLDS